MTTLLSRGKPRLIIIFVSLVLISLAAFLPSQRESIRDLTKSFPSFSFTNDDIQVGEPEQDLTDAYPSSNITTPPGTAPNKPNAVIFILLPPSRIHQTLLALRNVEERFNNRLQYPYVLFTVSGEESQISETDRQKVSHITNGRTTWASVPRSMWDPPSWADQDRINQGLSSIGFTMGYRSMCRFYSAFFWKHPALEGYEWFWRLDTDIEFHCDIPYDPVQRMIDTGSLYGFIQIAQDSEWVQPTLAPNISQWMSQNQALLDKFSGGMSLPPSSSSSLSSPEHPPSSAYPKTDKVNLEFVWNPGEGVRKALNGEATNNDWTKKCMYNNFEISHRSMWESELYTSFADYLENAGGFFYERWSDSPIHSFGVAMLLRREQVLQFLDFGYQHQGWAYDCPEESQFCTCVREDRFAGFAHAGEGWYHPE